MVVQSKDLRIPRRTARSTRPLLEPELHTHLLPRVVGTKLGARRQVRFTSGRSSGRSHWFLGSRTGLRRRVIRQGDRAGGRLDAGAEQRAGSALADSLAEGHCRAAVAC